ncbi:hypothetical protein BH18GEM1_BH18GEM1_14340 [soil metagenome]
MRGKLAVAGASMIFVAGAIVFAVAKSPNSIEGTYRLVSRGLPDGTRLVPPQLQGLLTYTEEYRNFNIYWTDTEGKRMSISSIATYSLTDDEYTETSIYYMVNDEIGGAGLSYDLSGQSGSSPITAEDGGIAFSLPLFDEPNVVYEDDGFTASREGVFVDHWEEVE